MYTRTTPLKRNVSRKTDSPPGQFPLGDFPYPPRLGFELRVGLVELGLGLLLALGLELGLGLWFG